MLQGPAGPPTPVERGPAAPGTTEQATLPIRTNRLLIANPAGEAHSLEGLWGSARCIVQRAGSYVCPPGWTLRERAEPYHVLYICLSGGADFRIGGRPYRLDPHSVVLTPPRVLQSTLADLDPTEPLTLYVIQFAARL